MTSAGIEIKRTDKRSIQVPVPATAEQTVEFQTFVNECVQDGYYLSTIMDIQGGGQREPYTVGMKMTFVRR